jgi:hypothetical protein
LVPLIGAVKYVAALKRHPPAGPRGIKIAQFRKKVAAP